MADRYLEFVNGGVGSALASGLGLPKPPRLRRNKDPYAEKPLQGHTVLVGAVAGAQLARPLLAALNDAGARLAIAPALSGLPPLKDAARELNVELHNEPSTGDGTVTPAYVFDASGLSEPADLNALYEFFHSRVRSLPSNGRVVVVGVDPEAIADPVAAAAAFGLRGFVRSLGKELGRKGSTANLLEVPTVARDWMAGPLRFLLTPCSAYVCGQVLTMTKPPKGATPPTEFAAPLAGKRALVTGAARGIGAAIAAVLAREGAEVVGVDRPQEETDLGRSMAAIGGLGLPVDITSEDAPTLIADELARLGGVDVVVHNAGITRDKMLRNMPQHWWDQVIAVNLQALPRLTDALLNKGLNEGARIVCISSIGGIAGNAGQTNYGATKAGVIGYVSKLGPKLAVRGGGANAVAPGFIETAMTAAMPALNREVGRRLCSLQQAGLPEDIAEAVTFLSTPAAGGVNGQFLRVCGQNWVGA